MEGIAKRGSNEVGSSSLKFLAQQCREWNEILWSDTCEGQNRNGNIIVILMSLVNSSLIQATTIIHYDLCRVGTPTCAITLTLVKSKRKKFGYLHYNSRPISALNENRKKHFKLK